MSDLRVERRGQGPPLLLIHAGDLDGRMWGPLADIIDGEYSLLIPDLRGHGRTPAARSPFSHAEDLLELIDEEELDDVAIVAASYGGTVAIQLAGHAPDRVSSLVLLSAALADHEFGDEIQAAWEQEDLMLSHADIEGAIELGVRTWVRDDSVADLVRSMNRDAYLSRLGAEDHERELPQHLAAITAPTIAISGGLDFSDFSTIADRISLEVPDAHRAEVSDAGHLIALERPHPTAELVRGFVGP